MRVLFVRPSIYDTVCDWYERMNTVQKHRKETAICKSPEDFWDIFNKDKFGAQYTTFYFDDRLALTDTFEFSRRSCGCMVKRMRSIFQRIKCGGSP